MMSKENLQNRYSLIKKLKEFITSLAVPEIIRLKFGSFCRFLPIFRQFQLKMAALTWLKFHHLSTGDATPYPLTRFNTSSRYFMFNTLSFTKETRKNSVFFGFSPPRVRKASTGVRTVGQTDSKVRYSCSPINSRQIQYITYTFNSLITRWVGWIETSSISKLEKQ